MVRLLGRVSLSLFLLCGALVFFRGRRLCPDWTRNPHGFGNGLVRCSDSRCVGGGQKPKHRLHLQRRHQPGRNLPCAVPECRHRTRSPYEATGFKKLVRNDIPIRSTETLGLDVTLEVGNVVESVEVSAGAQLLETETSTTGHLVSGAELTTLPTPQMKIESMLWYVSGVTSQSGNGHTAGGRSRAFQMTTDGVSATNPGEGTVATARNVTTVEHDMEEVKVLTTALPAEYGHSGGGIMNISYKGGTNQFHGLAEERYVSKTMIHRAWYDPAVPSGAFAFHLMSANISGPIKRNKTFFLVGWQRHHERSGNNENADVPSPAMLDGDFSFPQSSVAGRQDLRPGFAGAAAERILFAHAVPEQSDSARAASIRSR